MANVKSPTAISLDSERFGENFRDGHHQGSPNSPEMQQQAGVVCFSGWTKNDMVNRNIKNVQSMASQAAVLEAKRIQRERLNNKIPLSSREAAKILTNAKKK